MNVGLIIRALSLLGVVSILASGAFYVLHLQKTVGVAEANITQLQKSIEKQQNVISEQQQNLQFIISANRGIIDSIEENNKRIVDLNKKVDAERLSKASRAKPKLVERLINKGTKNALRCAEVSSGAPLTVEEKNVEKLSNANRECPHIHPLLQYSS